MTSGLVFSIEEFSVFDGPGIRTSVFICGCPLRCEWCHNPEGQSYKNHVVRSPNGCTKCGECIKRATYNGGKREFSENSINHCPNNLLRYCAVEYTPEALCRKLERNFKILNNGGGVTFSGGEPTSNPEFLLECLRLLRGKTHRAVQTSGYCKPEIFAKVLENCDYVLFDVKLIDDGEHRKYTGVSNELILQNFKTLVHSGKDFVIRTPLIPTVTDTERNVRGIAELLYENGVHYIELLPYNKFAGSKYQLDGRVYSPSFDESVPVEFRHDIFKEYGIESKRI